MTGLTEAALGAFVKHAPKKTGSLNREFHLQRDRLHFIHQIGCITPNIKRTHRRFENPLYYGDRVGIRPTQRGARRLGWRYGILISYDRRRAGVLLLIILNVLLNNGRPSWTEPIRSEIKWNIK